MLSQTGSQVPVVVIVAFAVLTSGGEPTRAAESLEVLYRFATGLEEPSSGLVQGADGALYGVTTVARPNTVSQIYRVSDGRLTVLHALSPAEGAFSGASLVLGNTDLFGTTRPSPGVLPGGRLFRLNLAKGSFSIVYRSSTATLAGSLLQAADGDLYGTMHGPGPAESAVFRISPEGEFSVAHSFAFVSEGTPNSLIQSPDGYLYGTTSAGGGGLSAGTIFGMSPTGGFAVLYRFQNGRTDEGASPVGVTQRADGTLWGTTSGGGGPSLTFLTATSPNASMGTVFKLGLDRKLVTLHGFTGADGATPLTPLVEAGDGVLYGTTSAGGAYGLGTIFRIGNDGKLSTVMDMTTPGTFRPLLRGRDGNVYGVRTGGMQGPSMIFRISVKQ